VDGEEEARADKKLGWDCPKILVYDGKANRYGYEKAAMMRHRDIHGTDIETLEKIWFHQLKL
jgi:hypothetical protein